MQRGNPIRHRFNAHRNGARKRGIEFKFTFEEWVSWWETHLGLDWLKLRGRCDGQYVMARKGDTGPYHPSNVRCVQAGENHAEAHPITKETIIAIFLDNRSSNAIAKELAMAPRRVADIKMRRTHTDITDSLPTRTKCTVCERGVRTVFYIES